MRKMMKRGVVPDAISRNVSGDNCSFSEALNVVKCPDATVDCLGVQFCSKSCGTRVTYSS